MEQQTNRFSQLQSYGIDFTDCELSARVYGGLSGKKIGVIYRGSPYMLKFQDNLRYRNLTGEVASYGNNPVAEYIASHVFEFLGIPVHETLLGVYKNKQVVACKDFGFVREFREFMASSVQFDATDDLNPVVSLDLNQVLEVIRALDKDPFSIKGAYSRFILTFVVDALNGNPDRNLGNWGYLEENGGWTLAPVYDNGSCLFVRFPESKMIQALQNQEYMYQLAVSGFTSRFKLGEHMLNPYDWITNNLSCPGVRSALDQVTSLDLTRVHGCIWAVCTDIQAEFYSELYRLRMQKLRQILSKF